MIEFKLALRYLSLRKKGLSRSLISIFSIGMITLIVWLLLVFLSVLEGVEKRWLQKVLSVTSPLRITPTEKYFASYDYQADLFSSSALYSPRTLGEILTANAPSYDALEDGELPLVMTPELDTQGHIIHPVERLKTALMGITYEEYELSGALLQLKLLRTDQAHASPTVTNFSQVTYLLNRPEHADDLILEKLPPYANIAASNPVILPKSYQDNGVRLGDEGHLSYQSILATKITEQKIPIYVQGFYDPGMMSLGGKCLLAPAEIVRTINKSSGLAFLDPKLSNGLFIRLNDLKKTKSLEKHIQNALQKQEIDAYWKVTPYTEYEFSKDLIQQFQSDKALFLLIGVLILLIASSNIISSLVLLVQDRRKEIGVLQALGMAKIRVISIFAIAGALIGFFATLTGIILAVLTMANIDAIALILGNTLGITLLNTPLFAEGLPKTLSVSAISFIAVATPIFSLLAGLIAAYKAAKIKPAHILKESSQ